MFFFTAQPVWQNAGLSFLDLPLTHLAMKTFTADMCTESGIFNYLLVQYQPKLILSGSRRCFLLFPDLVSYHRHECRVSDILQTDFLDGTVPSKSRTLLGADKVLWIYLSILLLLESSSEL